MFTASSRQRVVALVCYFVSAFLFLGFLLPLGDGGLAAIVVFFYIPISLIASVGAWKFPLSYCTVLKAMALAGMGALLPTVVVCGPYFFTHIIRAA
jgi:hypothetical protein